MTKHLQGSSTKIEKAQQSIEKSLWVRLLPRTWVKNAVERITPEGLIISWTISTAAGVVLPIELAISAASNAIGWENYAINIIRISILIALGLLSILSIKIEAQAYKELKFSASPYGTMLYAGTGKRALSAFLQLFQDHVQLSFSNPWVLAGFAHRDVGALVDGYLGISITVVLWYLFWNKLIVDKRLDPWLKRIKPITNMINRIRITIFKLFQRS